MIIGLKVLWRWKTNECTNCMLDHNVWVIKYKKDKTFEISKYIQSFSCTES